MGGEAAETYGSKTCAAQSSAHAGAHHSGLPWGPSGASAQGRCHWGRPQRRPPAAAAREQRSRAWQNRAVLAARHNCSKRNRCAAQRPRHTPSVRRCSSSRSRVRSSWRCFGRPLPSTCKASLRSARSSAWVRAARRRIDAAPIVINFSCVLQHVLPLARRVGGSGAN